MSGSPRLRTDQFLKISLRTLRVQRRFFLFVLFEMISERARARAAPAVNKAPADLFLITRARGNLKRK